MIPFNALPYGIDAHYSLCYYIPGGKDFLSRKILDFKDGHPNIVSSWGCWLADEVAEQNLKFDYVIRSLGSSETRAGGNRPVDRLGEELSRRFGLCYAPDIVAKSRSTTKLALLDAASRRAELNGVYYLGESCPDLSEKRLLILDDVVTTYTTTSAIVGVIRKRFVSANITAISLGRTERRLGANDGITMDYLTQSVTTATSLVRL